ncbi:MAG: stage II sporulation protein M [Clostridia bacterium]|nr:stage II sporulation protein M [Clostridia bacterium]
MNIGAIYRRQWLRFKDVYANWFLANLIFFIISGLAGYIYVINNPEITQAALKFIADKMPQFQPGQSLFLIILERNSLASLTFIGLGLITGGALTLVSILVNGGMVGALLGVFGLKGTVSPVKLLLFGILPHGILEIPAIALAGGLGMRLGVKAIQRLTKGGFSFKQELVETIITYGAVILPVLVIAALVESVVTPVLIKSMLPGLK